MLIKLTRIFLLFLCISISACSTGRLNKEAYRAEAPINYQFESTPQYELNASQDWSIIAKDIVDQLKSTSDRYRLSKRAFYLNLQSQDTEFTMAFKDFLVQHALKSGIKITNRQSNAIVLNYKVQLVEFNAFRSMHNAKKFSLTRLGAGVIVAREFLDLVGANKNVGKSIISAFAIDSVLAQFAPQTELIVSTSILNKNIYIHKSNDIYYAESLDKDLYLTKHKKHNAKNNVFEDPFYQ